MPFLLLLLALPALGQDFAPLREFIQSKLKTDNVPSVAVAVAREGKIIFEAGFGWANREQHVAANDFLVEQAIDASRQFNIRRTIIAAIAGALQRPELRELRLPIS